MLVIIKLAIKMKEPFFSKNPLGPSACSQQDMKQYTYFDSTTKKYLERRRKNELKREQEQEQRHKQELQQCTFRPLLTSQHYYKATRQTQIKPTTAHNYSTSNKKEEPYVRLLNWNHRRETQQRSKLIQRQVTQMVLRQSLSIDKRKRSPRVRGDQEKMNRSLEETFRSEDSSEEQFRSINAVAVLSREELDGEGSSQPSYYQTFQSSKKRK